MHHLILDQRVNFTIYLPIPFNFLKIQTLPKPNRPTIKLKYLETSDLGDEER